MSEPTVDDDIDDWGQGIAASDIEADGASDGAASTFLGLESADAQCPWCGEWLEWVVDPTANDAYVEDCYVCCRPCIVCPTVDEQGRITSIRIDCE